MFTTGQDPLRANLHLNPSDIRAVIGLSSPMPGLWQ